MSWRCWFFKHKWIDAMDESLLQCENCPKLRPKPPPPTPPPPSRGDAPEGSSWCPHPGCTGWVGYPPHYAMCEGVLSQISEYDSVCTFCKQPIRWRKFRNDDGTHSWRYLHVREPNNVLPDGMLFVNDPRLKRK